ncbi:MAG TPA: DHH family phosphoesterase [Rudaea sp.]|nr:DHH family phosphoesterase [Rudaea sp.]
MKPRIERRSVPASAAAWPEAMHPVLRRIYAARGIAAPQEVEHRLAALAAPHALGGMRRACELVEQALRGDERIIVVGDFDCDGATGTAVAVRGLRLLGARDVGYAVPNRFRHGYGLSPALVEELLPQRPQLLITVDNGVAAIAGVAAARAHGIRVLVTDHHLPGSGLPAADALVNPNVLEIAACAHGENVCAACAADTQLNRGFSSRALAGVGVVFYFLLALRAHLRERAWFAARAIAEPDLAVLLDLVALGTVADLVPLDRNNRILVEAGLKRMRAGKCCAGIAALLDSAGRDKARLTAADLGFSVGPRINAAGRLDDMRFGIECLLTDDAARARELAERLSAINGERRELQTTMVADAHAALARWHAERGGAELPVGLVLFDPSWHHGVVGLVASKLRESLNRPVIACAPAEQGEEVKASGRSVPGFHLRDALAEIDARRPGLLARFGGHAMAAGMSLRRDGVAELASEFDRVARTRIPAEQLAAVVLTDGELGAEDWSLDLAQQLRYGGPWGQGFAEPQFDGAFVVEAWKTVGESHLRMTLRSPLGGPPLTAIAFDALESTPPPPRLRAVYHLDIDEWNGLRRLQLLVRDFWAEE